jgi:hypothetical protein
VNSPLFAVLSIALFVGAIAWRLRAWQREQRARENLVAFALAKGWDLVPPDPSLLYRWPGDPFKGGTNPRCATVITGTFRDRSFTAFEYMHDKVTRDSNGRERKRTQRFTVCVLALPGYLPVIQVEPESSADRALGAIGWSRDQEFESEDFNRAFKVTSDRPRVASDLLAPRTLQMLVSRPAFSWRTQGTDVVTWVPGIIDPMGLLARLDTMSAVIEGVPPFVWHDRGTDPDARRGTAPSDPVEPNDRDKRFTWEA